MVGTVGQDHPRIRGTNLVGCSNIDGLLGSPPHTRDKYITKLFLLFSIGITPAYAGQIALEISVERLLRDHPRIRGTNID